MAEKKEKRRIAGYRVENKAGRVLRRFASPGEAIRYVDYAFAKGSLDTMAIREFGGGEEEIIKVVTERNRVVDQQ